MATVKFKFGVQSAYDNLKAAGTLESDALYFIQDTSRLYRGGVLFASDNVEFVTAVPTFSEAVAERLYIVQKPDEYCIYVKGDTEMVCINHVIEPGSILSLNAFAAGLVKTTADTLTPEDNASIPTTGAVVKAIAEVSAGLEWEELV